MMKSLKSIFPFFLVNTKNKCVKSEHFLSLSEMHSEMLLFALNFFEFKREEPPRLFSLLCFLSRTKRRREKKKRKRNLLPHRTRSRRLRRRRCRPTFPFVSFSCFSCSNFCFADRFWTRFDATDATTSFSLLFDSHFHRNDRSIRALFDVSFSSTLGRNIEKEKRYNKRRAVIKTFAQQQQKKQQKQARFV